jgi:hypothetical protein
LYLLNFLLNGLALPFQFGLVLCRLGNQELNTQKADENEE